MKKSKKDSSKKIKRDLSNKVVNLFTKTGFTHINSEGKHIEYENVKTELDAIFLYENLVIIEEHTTLQDVSDHLRKKETFFEAVFIDISKFIVFLSKNFNKIKSHLNKHSQYSITDYKLVYVYSSYHPIKGKLKEKYSRTCFLDYLFLEYFTSLTNTIEKSARFELYRFLGIEKKDLCPSTGNDSKEIEVTLLPEARSGFDKGFDVVTFHIDPETLIELSYVLRRDGNWLDNDALYQRILIPSKIKNIRDYIALNKKVFINNLIVTLPENTKFINDNLKTENISQAQQAKISIPLEYNSIGIVDGQHRLYAYHEGIEKDKIEKKISVERKKQNLLITGIIYPRGYSDKQKLEFDSRMFLEINDKQTRVYPSLRQVIRKYTEPFLDISIAKAVAENLTKDGPLKDILESNYFDKGKVKTTSIVSYGLKLLVKVDGKDSLFNGWSNKRKKQLSKEKNIKILNEYIQYCTAELNLIFSSFREEISKKGLFTLDQRISRALTATSINGIIYCLRSILQEKKKRKRENYRRGFSKLSIDYSPQNFKYKSSHWKSLGDEIYKQCFKRQRK